MSQSAYPRVAIVGAGGHAKVVVATALACGYEIAGLYDDDPDKEGISILGVRVVGALKAAAGSRHPLVVAVGDNRARQQIAEGLGDARFATLVHPAATVHPSVEIGEGSVLFAGVIVQPDVRIGRHVILNTGATVDHDCRIGDWAHCGPGSHLAGGAILGDGCLIGIGSVVLPGIEIGARATVGAGSAAARNVDTSMRVGGVPARPLDSGDEAESPA